MTQNEVKDRTRTAKSSAPMPPDPRVREVLRRVFGYDHFRPQQDACIAEVLAGRDALLILPTGGGKSLCYQIPALLLPGLTVVVSPLISLMQDQVGQLQALGVEAELLNSTLSWEAYQMNMTLVRSGQTKILFMAPETLFKEDIQTLLGQVRFDLLVIDEAHCISEWGHDFRPEYRKLTELRKRFPQAVCLAMTATATPRVRRDIQVCLHLEETSELIGSFNRTNLFYEVIPKAKPEQQVLDFLQGFSGQSGIIYCFSRRQVDALTARLCAHGYAALPYHAGLGDAERQRHQEKFLRDDVQIIVATIAFGMGINKPNVRFVLHYDLPRNIESYYQETGRAGRDGLPSHCLLLFGYGDIHKIRYLIDQKPDPQERRQALAHLQDVIGYAETHVCRRRPLIAYFGETFPDTRCDRCDNCINPKEQLDVTVAAKKLLACVLRTGQRFGAKHVLDVLHGSQGQKVVQYEHNELDVHGIGRDLSVQQWQGLLRQFLQDGVLDRDDDKYGVLRLNARSFQVLQGKDAVQAVLPPKARPAGKAVKKIPSSRPAVAAGDNVDLLAKLKGLRKQLADERRVPPYIIFSDRSLIEMSQRRPRNVEEMSSIHGVGAKKLATLAARFLSVIREG